MSQERTPQGVYEHYKGGQYVVLFVAHNSTNSGGDQPMVVYVSMTTGRINVRDENEFHEAVWDANPPDRPRFRLANE